MTSQSTFDRQPSHNAFVGRDRELAELRAGLDDVSAGHGRLFLLSGEPGIGKTRLAEEISNDASARGMRAVWGRCWEGGGAPAYWPFIQILRSCVDERDSEKLETILGSGASEIARLIPELKLSLPSLEETKATTDSESARFRLFDAVATLFKNVARNEPLLMVVDDLHDADQPTLQMLRFVARETKNARILVVGTYRDAEVRQSPEVGKLIGDLIREGRTVAIAGLSRDEVGEFIERSAAKKADDKLVADLYQATDGNPLFVDGVVRLLAAEGELARTGSDRSAFKIPDGVRESIRRQLAALSDQAKSLLSIASVIGNEFDTRLLERVSTRSTEQVVEQTDEAVRIGVLRLGFPRQQFAHALIRGVFYDDLAANRRIELHREIGAAIEKIHKDDLSPHLAALAHHFQEAGDSNKAIDYLSRAGDEARRVYANEDALSHWSAAIELVEEFGGNRRLFAALHHRLGELMGGQGERGERLEHLEEALRTYEELGDADAAAELHLSLGNNLSLPGLARAQDIPRAADHLQRAEAVLSKGPESPNLVLLYYLIGNVAARSCRVRDAIVAFRHSIEIAERIGAPAGTVNSPIRSFSWLGRNADFWAISAASLAWILPQTGKIGEALEVQAQVWSKLDTLHVPGTAYAAAARAGSCLMELWDPRGAQKWWATELEKSRLGRGQRRVFMRLLQDAYLLAGDLAATRSLLAQGAHASAAGMLAFYEGEWERADSILEQGLERERARSGMPREMLLYGQALARVRWVRCEPARAETLLRDALALYPEEEPNCQVEMVVRPELALVYLEMGRLEDAVAEVSRCREVSAGEDWRGLGGHLARADAAVAAGAGKLDAAMAGFEIAVTIFRKYALPWEEADTLHRWGRAMSAAGAPARAIEKFDAAIEIYRSRGAGVRFIDYVMADKMRARGCDATAVETATSPVAGRTDCIFRREGEYWTLAYEGRTSRLKDAKGMHYMAYLLAHPGEEIRALDLVTRIGGGGEETVQKASAEDLSRSDTASGDLGHAGEILDAQAKAAYQRRLTELEEELEEAREFKDEERIAKAEDEREALGRELRGAIGLAGRDRRSASATERGRIAVTKAIRLSLNKIAENDASLGKLLSTTIKTGTVCAYVPDERFPVSWRL
jgi:tetratricopeptide (TPR) repeat protein